MRALSGVMCPPSAVRCMYRHGGYSLLHCPRAHSLILGLAAGL
jgi:hypothetical protein